MYKTMTKQNEKEALDSFIAALPPDSYLFSILSQVQLEVSKAIDDDICFIDWAVLSQEQTEQRATIKKLEGQIQELRSQKIELERDIEKRATMLDHIRQEARRIAKIVGG